MNRVVFVDLDDTLFQTSGKNPVADRLAAVDKQGQPLSFQCGKQAAFTEWLTRDALVVPVTGRSVQAFRQVVLPLGPRAICSFGGVILGLDGTPHPDWHRETTRAATATAPAMADLHAAIAAAAEEDGIDARHRIIEDAGLPLYISVKHNSGSSAEMSRLASAVSPAVPTGWTLHLNGTNMAALPPFLGKERAVAFFLETVLGNDPVLTVGVGDSLTDVGFMALCDYTIAPSRSQIVSMLCGRPASAVGEVSP